MEQTEFKVGNIIEVTVVDFASFGVFCKCPNNYKGLIHVSNININFKKNKKSNFVQNYEFTWTQKEKTYGDNHTKQNANKHQSLNDKQTQMLLDNIDGIQNQNIAKNSKYEPNKGMYLKRSNH